MSTFLVLVQRFVNLSQSALNSTISLHTEAPLCLRDSIYWNIDRGLLQKYAKAKVTYGRFTPDDTLYQIWKHHGVERFSLSRFYSTWVAAVPKSQPMNVSDIISLHAHMWDLSLSQRIAKQMLLTW